LLILAAVAAAVIPVLAQEMPAPARADSAIADSAGADPGRIAALEKEVIPVIRRSCSVSGCHEGERPKANLDLSANDLRPALLDVPSRQVKEIFLIDSKDPGRSYMLMKVAGGEGIKGRKMPVGNVPGLSAEEISLFADWVRNFGKAGIETGR
jgi:hypothetical protein